MNSYNANTRSRKAIIFHVGMPKTATTFFQELIFPSLENVSLITPLSETDHNAFCSVERIENTGLYKKLASALELEKTVIVSDEKLSNAPLSIRNICKSIEYIKKSLCVDVRIFIMLRNQEHFATSYWKQWISSMVPHKKPYMIFEDWLEYQDQHVMRLLQYDELLNSFLDLVGKNNLTVRLYEDFLQGRIKFIQDICRDLGLEGSERIRSLPIVNKSISNIEMMLKKKVRFIEGQRGKILWEFTIEPGIKAMRRLPLKAFEAQEISDKARSVIGNRVGYGNRWVEQQFELNLRKWGYPGV